MPSENVPLHQNGCNSLTGEGTSRRNTRECDRNQLCCHYIMFLLTCNNWTVINLGLKPPPPPCTAVGQKTLLFYITTESIQGCLVEVLWVFLWYFIPPDSGCFIWLYRDGVPARPRVARHPSSLYHSSVTYHTIGCRSRTIPPLFCSLKLKCSRRRKQNGDVFIPSWFSALLSVYCLLSCLTSSGRKKSVYNRL